MNPSPLCDDATFMRRAYLDAIGLLPTADEARAFLADPSPDKRTRLIDDLLAAAGVRRALGAEMGRPAAERGEGARRQRASMSSTPGFATGSPPASRWISSPASWSPARGSTYENPPANFYRANRDPLTRGETAARLFLGVRLQCARCHNHPFDRWTQDDYYSWAAVFGRIDYQIVENNRRDRLDKHEFNGEQIVLIKDEGEVKTPRTGSRRRAEIPGRLCAAIARRATIAWRRWPTGWRRRTTSCSSSRRPTRLVSPARPRPGRADRRLPRHQPAQQSRRCSMRLARDFAASGFDLRHLVRTIMNSRTYQLAAEPNDTNATTRRTSRGRSSAGCRRRSCSTPSARCSDVGGRVQRLSAGHAGRPGPRHASASRSRDEAAELGRSLPEDVWQARAAAWPASASGRTKRRSSRPSR